MASITRPRRASNQTGNAVWLSNKMQTCRVAYVCVRSCAYTSNRAQARSRTHARAPSVHTHTQTMAVTNVTNATITNALSYVLDKDESRSKDMLIAISVLAFVVNSVLFVFYGLPRTRFLFVDHVLTALEDWSNGGSGRASWNASNLRAFVVRLTLMGCEFITLWFVLGVVMGTNEYEMTAHYGIHAGAGSIGLTQYDLVRSAYQAAFVAMSILFCSSRMSLVGNNDVDEAGNVSIGKDASPVVMILFFSFGHLDRYISKTRMIGPRTYAFVAGYMYVYYQTLSFSDPRERFAMAVFVGGAGYVVVTALLCAALVWSMQRYSEVRLRDITQIIDGLSLFSFLAVSFSIAVQIWRTHDWVRIVTDGYLNKTERDGLFAPLTIPLAIVVYIVFQVATAALKLRAPQSEDITALTSSDETIDPRAFGKERSPGAFRY